MRGFLFGRIGPLVAFVCLLASLSCGHDQQLVSIDIQPSVETFGAADIPVANDAGLSVQLRALGHYIHPPVTKDITDQVTWVSNTPQMIKTDSTGLITATGISCGGALVTATKVTNTSVGGIGSTGALVSGTMTANVICFTGNSTGTSLLTVTFLGAGTGRVTITPPNQICQSSCTIGFPTGSGPITLTAMANGTFGGWANCSSVNGNVCTVNTLSSDLTVSATFN